MTRQTPRSPMSRPAPTTPRPASRTERASARPARVAVAALVGLVGGAGLVGGLAAPAVAHDALTSATPADGSSVEVPPASVDLTFSEPPLGIGAEVRVTGPDGAVVNAGDLAITDTTVSQPIADELPAGGYSVAWRVTSSDGHPISGELTFSAGAGTAGVAPVPTPGATASPDDATGPTAEPAPAETPGVAAGDDATGDGTDDAASSTPARWVGIAVVLLAAAGAVGWAVRRRTGSGTAG